MGSVLAKSEFGDDYEKTTVLSGKDLELFTPNKQGGARSAYLIVINGRSVGKMYKLSGDRVVIGRQATNEILIDDEGVSRRHAYVERAAAGLVLVDGERQPDGRIKPSTNGVFVNGNKVDRHLLQDGDKVQLGSSTILKFSFQDEIEEQFHQQQYEAATRDGLTNAYNKKYFADQLKTDFAFYFRHSQPLSLVLFDIDFFKKLNDGYGHMAGDYVLKTLAGLVQKALRTEDVFARYGGEEFGIILRDTDGERAFLICERIRRNIENYQFLYEGKRLPVTISMGIATLHNASFPNPKALVKAADEYLYQAKHKGRNRTESGLLNS
jgi:two-component system cell cycle response regulator